MFSNSLKENLITNWIENEENQSSTIFAISYKNSKLNFNDKNADSLQIENLQRLSTIKQYFSGC